jgi:hypothetical protein
MKAGIHIDGIPIFVVFVVPVVIENPLWDFTHFTHRRVAQKHPTTLWLFLIVTTGLFPILSVPACCLWMEISFSIVLQRKTLMKNEVNEDGSVAVFAPV